MKEIREKYIERIYEIKKKKGYIRAIDLAKEMNIKPSSVTEMLQKLSRDGYIKYEKYRLLDLTDKGLNLAEKLEKTHQAIKKLLMHIGVDESTADRDACLIEHILSRESINKIENFVKNL